MKLSDDQIFLYAAKNYNNPLCADLAEFKSDINILNNLKKLFTRYEKKDELRENLIINHLISFFNVFHYPAAFKLLFHNINPSHYKYLKAFLVYLDRCPNAIKMFDNTIINLDDISEDAAIVEKLNNEKF